MHFQNRRLTVLARLSLPLACFGRWLEKYCGIIYSEAEIK
jgi:hypothetical protein